MNDERVLRMPGTLYIVATPIGNLADISLRALSVLREVDLIAAEDTRVTHKLLSHYGIATKTTPYHQHSLGRKSEQLLELLKAGRNVAIVSDAGMPGISDPGHELITMAIQHDIPVVPIPGANAIITSLVVSGLSTRRFTFEGFPPRRASDRRSYFKGLVDEPRTMVFYESPHRLLSTLKDLLAAWGDRRMTVVREATKVFEEVHRGTITSAIERFTAVAPKGEITLVAAGCESEEAQPSLDGDEVETALRECLARGLTRRDAVHHVAAMYPIAKSEVYRRMLAMKKVIGAGGDMEDGSMSSSPIQNGVRGGLSPALKVLLFLIVVLFVEAVVGGIVLTVLAFVPGSGVDMRTVSVEKLPLGALTAMAFASGVAGVLATLAFMVMVDRRPPGTLGLNAGRGWKAEVWSGIVLGAVLVSLMFTIAYAFCWIKVTGLLFNRISWRVVGLIAESLVLMASVAVSEEVIVRGYVLPALRSKYGTAVALVVSSVLFGLLHGANPGASFPGVLGTTAAGLVLGYAYLVTGRLWLPVGLHFAWNFAEWPLFGFHVSGLNLPALVQQRVTGPLMWTGGEFGPEAGLLTPLVLILGVLAIWRFGRFGRRGRDLV